MKTTRFYFAIAAANVLECITAASFTEAKQIAAKDWLPYWDQIEWIEPSLIQLPSTLPVIIDD
jgi:hypothetical protein